MSLEIASFDRVYEFLLAFHSNYVLILQRFWSIARFMSKIADCNVPHLYLALPLRVTSLKFRLVPGLSYGVVCVILCLAVLIQCWLVTDGQKEWRTDKRIHDDSIYCASISSRGKNQKMDFDAPTWTWMPSPSRRPAVTFDLWSPESNRVISEYFLSFIRRLIKPFMRYRGNKMCPEERTDGRTRRMDVWRRRHNNNYICILALHPPAYGARSHIAPTALGSLYFRTARHHLQRCMDGARNASPRARAALTIPHDHL